MLKFVILLAIIGYALGAVVPKGMLPQLNGRIVNGAPASISSFPWQISLQRNGAHSCGGSIYSREIIVTAAHCLDHAFISVLRVRAGSSFWLSGGVLVGVKAFKIHENYNSATYVNDIAVLWMSYSLAFSPTIRPIPLASITPKNGTDAIVSGWGVTESGSSSIPSQLKSVNMVILSRDQCASSNYKYGSNIKEGMICAFHLDSDSCQGDSGGPLVSNGALVGVVSWGYGCAFSPYPGVYSDVAALRSWIVNNANSIYY